MTGGGEAEEDAEPLALRLYVAGSAPNSTTARLRAEALVARLGPGRATLEVVDVLDEPGRALADGVLVTPLLVRVSPAPERRVVGDLHDEEALLRALGLPADSAGHDGGGEP